LRTYYTATFILRVRATLGGSPTSPRESTLSGGQFFYTREAFYAEYA
jgi:hypothetical protein